MAGFWMPNQPRPQSQMLAGDIDYRRMGPPPQIMMEESWRTKATSDPARDPLRITIANEARLAAEAQTQPLQPAAGMNWQRADEILRSAEDDESLQITIGNELAKGTSGPGGLDLLGGDDEGDLGSLLEQLAQYSNTYDAAETAANQRESTDVQRNIPSSFPPLMSSGFMDRSTHDSSSQELRYSQLGSQYHQMNVMRGAGPMSGYRPQLPSYPPPASSFQAPPAFHPTPTSSTPVASGGQLTHAEQMALYEKFSEAPPSIQRSFLTQVPSSAPSAQVPQQISGSPASKVEEEGDEQEKIKKVLESLGFNFDLSQKMQLLAEMTRKKEQELIEKRQKEQQMKVTTTSVPATQQEQTRPAAPQSFPSPQLSADKLAYQPPQNPATMAQPVSYPPPSLGVTQPPGVAAAQPPPGTEPGTGDPYWDLRQGRVRDTAWEQAARQFEEKLKQPTARKRRSSSSSSSSGKDRRRSSSEAKKAKKKAEEDRKNKKKAEEERKNKERAEKEKKVKEEKERKLKEEQEKREAEAEQKKLLKVQLEAEAAQLIEKMKEMGSIQSQQDKKTVLLRGELDRLKRQHGELCRKVQRQKDGHKDPLLVENARLQAAIMKQLKQIEVSTEEFNKFAVASDKRLAEIREKRKEIGLSTTPPANATEKTKIKQKSKERDSSTDSKRKDKKKSKKNKDTEKNIYYAYFDAGSHWCTKCSATFATIFDMFQHIHSDQHKTKLDLRNAPWIPEGVKDPSKKEAPKNVSIMIEPIKGVEFLMPCPSALYCDLCKAFVGDYLCAEDHLRSQIHGENYRKNLELHPLYERTIAMEKATGTSKKGGVGQTGTVSRPDYQEIATEDIKVTVKNTEANKQKVPPTGQKAQPGFGLIAPAGQPTGQKGPAASSSPSDPSRSVLKDGPKMQIKITQQPATATQEKKTGGGQTPQKKPTGRSFQEEKREPSRRSSRLSSRSPPRSYSRRSVSPRNRKRSLSPPPSRGRYDRRRSRSRSRSRDRRYRSRSRELPYRTPPSVRPTGISAYEQRQKALREEEEARKKERQQMIEEAKKKNVQMVQSQRVADAIKRQLEGKASTEDLKILATYGKEQLLAQKQHFIAKAAEKGNILAVPTQPQMRPVVPPPSEFLERFKSATKHLGVVRPVGPAKPEPQTQTNVLQRKEAPRESEQVKSEERKSSGEDEWHLSLPDATGDQQATINSPEQIPLLDSFGSNLDDLSELADLADKVVKDMNEKKEATGKGADDDFASELEEVD